METWLWAGLIIPCILLFVLLVAVKRGKKTGQVFDYFGFFISGLLWLPVGLIFKNYPLAILGGLFLVLGLINKDKWKKTAEKKSSAKAKKWQVMLLTGLGLICLFALTLWLIKEIK